MTVSEFTRNQICSRFHLPQDAVEVIPNSVADSWYAEAPLPLEARDPHILTVSGDAPSKNLAALIEAFALFTKGLPGGVESPVLRVVGLKPEQQPHYHRIADRFHIAGLVRFESFLGDAGLRALYQRASLFVMPSLFEGFGIPVAEAMACGTPVTCSNTTSLPEVLQGAGWLFDPRDVANMAAVMREAWMDRKGRQVRSVSSVEKARRFRESVVARRVTEFWGNA